MCEKEFASGIVDDKDSERQWSQFAIEETRMIHK